MEISCVHPDKGSRTAPKCQAYEIRIGQTGSVPKQEELSGNPSCPGEAGGWRRRLWWWSLGIVRLAGRDRSGMSRGGKVTPCRGHLYGTWDVNLPTMAVGEKENRAY